MKEKILFMCIKNSCRSQIAEGYMRSLHGDSFDVYSAGVEASEVNPNAAKVMSEDGIDISSHTSNTADAFDGVEFDYLVTVCADGAENCPYIPTRKGVIHHSFDDPPYEAAKLADVEEQMDVYRRVRNEIKDFISALPGRLGEMRQAV